MAGVPFDVLEEIATPATFQAAKDLLAAEREFAQAKLEVEEFLACHREEFSKEQLRAWNKAIRSGVIPAAEDEISSSFSACWRSAAKVAGAEGTLTDALVRDLASARDALFTGARKYLPSYLVFAADGVRERVINKLTKDGESIQTRKKQARADERHLLLYLQRIAGKNDSLSAFGPQGWGTIKPGIGTLELDPQPGIARRETFLERWAAHGAAAAINADPEARAEISPRLHPHARIEQDHLIFTETGASYPLDAEMLDLLLHCDGTVPAHSLGANLETLRILAQ
ncbi:MAG: hypothetical protein H0T83_04840, partial [Chthoniobacterales bacterium]|nr:hypothetical protein [Chthoniobacterales bacterium]